MRSWGAAKDSDSAASNFRRQRRDGYGGRDSRPKTSSAGRSLGQQAGRKQRRKRRRQRRQCQRRRRRQRRRHGRRRRRRRGLRRRYTRGTRPRRSSTCGGRRARTYLLRTHLLTYLLGNTIHLEGAHAAPPHAPRRPGAEGRGARGGAARGGAGGWRIETLLVDRFSNGHLAICHRHYWALVPCSWRP